MSESSLFLDFRKFYERDINLLNHHGVYIPIKKMKYPNLFAAYCVFVFFPIMLAINCSEYFFILFECHSVQDFAGNGFIANICMMANIRAYYLFEERKDLVSIFENLNNPKFQPIDKETKLIAEKSLMFYTKVKRALTTVSLLSGIFAVATPIFYSKNGGLPLAAWYPFNASQTPIHQLMYLYQAVALYFESMINIETDVLASGLFTFIGIQCDFLCHKLYSGSETSMKSYIEDHQRIQRLAKKCEKVFSKIYFFQFFATTSGLCMTLFLLTSAAPNTFEFFFLVIYQMAIFNLLLVPSWFSSQIRRKSEIIPIAAYFHPWVDAKKCFKRDLVMFIQNTQRPIQLKALGFFNLSLEVFLKIVQSSFSYYTMLKNIST